MLEIQKETWLTKHIYGISMTGGIVIGGVIGWILGPMQGNVKFDVIIGLCGGLFVGLLVYMFSGVRE